MPNNNNDPIEVASVVNKQAFGEKYEVVYFDSLNSMPPDHDDPQQIKKQQSFQGSSNKDLEVANDHPCQTKISAIRRRTAPLMLYIVSIAQFIDIMNGSAMAVALVDISKSLGFDNFSTQWIISSYIVTFGGFLLLAGRTGDIYGHRTVFLIGQIWFGLWSLVVSFSTTPAMFCITRALQGIGASMSVPTALGIITTTFPEGPKRTRALSIFGGFGAAGAVIGLLLAGALIASMTWNWIFRFSAIFSFILFGLGLLAIPLPTSVEKKDDHKPNIDVAGALTVTSSLICIIYYISTGPAIGWGSAQTLPVLAAGLVLMGVFLWLEIRSVSNPIMPLRIWHLKSFPSAFLAVLFLQGQFQGFVYYSTLIFQNVLSYDSMKTALVFLPHSIGAIIAFAILGKILPRCRLKPFILTGFMLRCGAALMFAFVNTNTSYWTLPFLGLLIHVAGLGTSVLPVQITALKDAQKEDQGVVGGAVLNRYAVRCTFGLGDCHSYLRKHCEKCR
ncbi:major facilitator superfamily domain-containing protein [Lobosporangium transversale]|uniref:Major facilitator superfamily domain-containing protein n=1 Tax=Lobosporangium transversale TaxID=64571 RepID=A0A1Y2H3H2_9FUNG|nr:major facilitator superfamily domain-containing protein [Lobosporangium transversale]ORZ29065.1 major facilitator superfamily domain-containing protein [Lobosporangium transversale]|eukprot:XP_021886738.1 major facilitator superfamily domain-containing protein [Lobosporangium transversale]